MILHTKSAIQPLARVYAVINLTLFWSVLICLVLLTWLSVSKADDLKLCRAPYALTSANFNYSEYSAQTKDIGNYTVTWIWNSFGNNLQNAKTEVNQPNVTGIEVILFNAVCVRNGNCGSYETLSGYNKGSLAAAINSQNPTLKSKMQNEAKRAADWIRGNLPSGKQCRINPFLEHNLDRATWSKAVAWIQPSFSGLCDIVWNPMGASPGMPQGPGIISEGHGDAPTFGGARCIANPDGTNIGASSYPSYLAKYGNACDLACTWGPNDNCRSPADKGFTDPRQRPCKDTGDFKVARAALIGARKLAVQIPQWSAEDEKAKFGCGGLLDTSDGAKKDFLWKQSDPAVLDRGAVTFLPRKLNSQKIDFAKVFVMKGGAVVARAYQRGVYTEDKSNRQFYRFHRLAVDFPFNVVVHYGKICAVLQNPKVRND